MNHSVSDPKPAAVEAKKQPFSLIQFLVEHERVLALLVSVVGLSMYGWATDQERIDWNFEGEVFLRLAIMVCILFGTIAGASHIWRKSDVAGETWWNIGRKLDDPTWEGVLRMTLGAVDDDPVSYISRPNRIATATKSVAGYLLIGCLLIEATTIVASGPVTPRLLPSNSTDADGLSANLTALLALLAAAASIHFAYRQLQAKVRADSRQAWIDKLRSHIARFIALADYAHSSTRSRAKSLDPDELTTCRIEMELMLNPSEKDHRLLMYLCIRIAFFPLGEREFRSIHDVRNIRKAIGLSDDKLSEEWVAFFGPIPSRGNPCQYASAYSDLIGYTLRLSHVVLKREWERVKATR